MMKKATLLTIAGVVAVGLLAVSVAEAQYREAKPGRTNPNSVIRKVGGADCASAEVIPPVDPLNYVDTGSTCGAAAVVSDYAGGSCANSYPYPGPELIYQLDLGANNDVEVTLQPTGTADLAVFMVSDCNNTTNCVGFQDSVGGGIASRIAFDVSAPAQCDQTVTPANCPPIGEGSYWIYIDSFYTAGPASCGDYTLTVAGTVPVELMEFTVE